MAKSLANIQKCDISCQKNDRIRQNILLLFWMESSPANGLGENGETNQGTVEYAELKNVKQKGKAPMDFTKLTNYLNTLEKRYGIRGLDMKVTRNHTTVYRHMAGCSDYEGTRPVSDRDLYDIYSCSKVITMVGVMQLIEQGRLGLMDPLEKYLPEFGKMRYAADFRLGEFPFAWPTEQSELRPAKNPILIHDLMSMTAGLSYDVEAKPIRELAEATNAQASTRQIVGAIAKMPLLYEPGTRYCYSLGHDVLAAVIEVVAGMPFGRYMREHVFQPLDITDMYYQIPEEQSYRLSAQYARDLHTGEIRRDNTMRFRITKRYESGGAGLATTVDEYSKVAEALANDGVGGNGGKILTRASIDTMRRNWLTERQLADFSRSGKVGYGYGLGVRTLMDATKARSPVGEFGWDGAAGAFSLIDPENHISIFYVHQILGMLQAYSEIHPTLRDLTYEALGL